MATHRRLVEEGPDYYSTPRWGTKALLKHVTFQGSILEPCCGDGEMSRVLEEAGYIVHSFDKYDRGYGHVCDFFDIKEKYDNIVTNPPFSIAEDVLEHALKLAQNKVCLLLRLAFLESQRRYQKFYHLNPPSRVLVFSERLSIYPKNYEVKAGGTTSYAWFCWSMIGPVRTTTNLEWIVPGAKGSDTYAIPTPDDNDLIFLENTENDPIIWDDGDA